MPQKRMKCFRLLFDHFAWIELQFLSGIKDSRKPGCLWGMMRGVGGVRKSIHQSWLAKGLGLLCWGFKGVQEEIPWEEASTLQIGSVTFPLGQCTSLQLHPCHRQFDGHQDSSSNSLESRPCSLWLSVIPQAQRLSLWDNWGDEGGCDKGHCHAHTWGLPCGLPEVVVTVQQVHCSLRRLRRRGLQFNVLPIKVPIRKKYGNVFNYSRIYTYMLLMIYLSLSIYIYIYMERKCVWQRKREREGSFVMWWLPS